jgi:predicted Co/Zn/Cd cation transporter (cation efflux family)
MAVFLANLHYCFYEPRDYDCLQRLEVALKLPETLVMPDGNHENGRRLMRIFIILTIIFNRFAIFKGILLSCSFTIFSLDSILLCALYCLIYSMFSTNHTTH